jgi:hypothetical protein
MGLTAIEREVFVQQLNQRRQQSIYLHSQRNFKDPLALKHIKWHTYCDKTEITRWQLSTRGKR